MKKVKHTIFQRGHLELKEINIQGKRFPSKCAFCLAHSRCSIKSWWLNNDSVILFHLQIKEDLSHNGSLSAFRKSPWYDSSQMSHHQTLSYHHSRGFWNFIAAKDTRKGIGLQEDPSNSEAKGVWQVYIKTTSKYTLLVSEWSGHIFSNVYKIHIKRFSVYSLSTVHLEKQN